MAIRHFFRQGLSNTGWHQLASLTPRDFAVVRRKAEVLGVFDDPRGLVELLADEISKKQEAVGNAIGFDRG